MSAGPPTGSVVLEPLASPPTATPWLPGSKSIMNRALACAAFARGDSTLTGVLFSDDTDAMTEAVGLLGASVHVDTPARSMTISGIGGPATSPDGQTVSIDARLSGTTSRFMLPVLCASFGRFELTGGGSLLTRPFADQIDALTALGATIESQATAGHLPVAVRADGLAGGSVAVRSDLSSQFASGLMLAGPLMAEGLSLRFSGAPVSLPYLTMTQAVMQRFGASVEPVEEGGTLEGFDIASGGYRATDLAIEPDASAASYFMAAAAVTGGTVRIEGLGQESLQGDVAFASVLERMGATVAWEPDAVIVTGGALRGVEVDMRAISDTAQTLAAVAALAEGTTRVSGIGFIRGKETDRIAAVVTELRRCGIDATEDADGFTIVGDRAGVRPARIATYDDHRMAMSFSVLGLVAPGIEILDAGCVSKTFPTFFEEWEKLGASRA